MGNRGIAEQQENRQRLIDIIPLDTPLQMQLELASVCNFKCRFCIHHDNDMLRRKGVNFGVMDEEIFQLALDGIKEFPQKIKLINLQSRGESLLNKNIGAMVKKLKLADVTEKIGLYTNGSLLTPEMSDALIDGGVDVLHVSIEGMSSEKYLEVCGIKVDFEEIVSNVKYFYNNKKDTYLYVKTMDNELTQKEKDRFYDVFENIADNVFIENPVDAWKDAEINIKYLKKDRYKTNAKSAVICPRIFFSMVVHHDGTVVACDHDWSEQYVIGHVKDSSIIDIWNGKKMGDLRKRHVDGRADEIGRCKECVSRTECLERDNIDAMLKK